jgi:glycosyltransferase involved in cell wall biosynthesis
VDAVAPEGRTLLVFHLGGVGGPGHSMLPVTTELARRGGVEVLVPEPGWAADRYAELGRVSVGRYSALTYARGLVDGARLARRVIRETRGFRAAFRRRRPELVIVVTSTLPAALVAARLEGIPAVAYAAEIYDQQWKDAPLLHVWGRLLAHGTALAADVVVCCSETVARQFPSRSDGRLAIAYPPIRSELANGDRGRGRHRHGVEDADPCLAVIGALSRGRGQDVALRALPLVRERIPTARLLVVGEPHPRAVDIAYAEELRALASELGIAGSVVFAGASDEMADVYAAADVVVNPARFAEPFGRVAPEALVAGVPVVASRVGALEEVIGHDRSGLLVPPDDPTALAEASIRLWEDRELREELVTQGRAEALARFSEAQNLAVWANVLELSRQKAPRPLATA